MSRPPAPAAQPWRCVFATGRAARCSPANALSSPHTLGAFGGSSVGSNYLANSPLVEEIVFTNNGQWRMTTRKQYDGLGRLTSIGSSNTQAQVISSYEYQHDLTKRRTRAEIGGGGERGTDAGGASAASPFARGSATPHPRQALNRGGGRADWTPPAVAGKGRHGKAKIRRWAPRQGRNPAGRGGLASEAFRLELTISLN